MGTRSISRENRQRHDAIIANQSCHARRDAGFIGVDCLGHSRDEGDAGTTSTAPETFRDNSVISATSGGACDEAGPGKRQSGGNAIASTGGDAD